MFCAGDSVALNEPLTVPVLQPCFCSGLGLCLTVSAKRMVYVHASNATEPSLSYFCQSKGKFIFCWGVVLVLLSLVLEFLAQRMV